MDSVMTNILSVLCSSYLPFCILTFILKRFVQADHEATKEAHTAALAAHEAELAALKEAHNDAISAREAAAFKAIAAAADVHNETVDAHRAEIAALNAENAANTAALIAVKGMIGDTGGSGTDVEEPATPMLKQGKFVVAVFDFTPDDGAHDEIGV